MPAPILVAYATRYGSTAEVAQFIASALEGRGLPAACRPARQERPMGWKSPLFQPIRFTGDTRSPGSQAKMRTAAAAAGFGWLDSVPSVRIACAFMPVQL